jgi:hypothetical protein
MTGTEYLLTDVMEPHLFVIRKQRRENPEKSNAMLAYYILDGSIYQAPQLCNVFASRIVNPSPSCESFPYFAVNHSPSGNVAFQFVNLFSGLSCTNVVGSSRIIEIFP